MCLQRGLLPERCDTMRRPNRQTGHQDHVAINAFEGRLIAGSIIRLPTLLANCCGPESPDVSDYYSCKRSCSEQKPGNRPCPSTFIRHTAPCYLETIWFPR